MLLPCSTQDLVHASTQTPLFYQPHIHGPEYWAGTRDHPDIYTYLTFAPFPTLDAFLTFMDKRFQRDPHQLIFAVLDKTSSKPWPKNGRGENPPLAGLVGYLDASPENLSAEVGMVICLPAFRRRRVTYSAVSLVMQYALDLPSEGGLGLRRLQYQAHASNEASIGLAKSLRFRFEGTQRWQRVLGPEKLGNGKGQREGDPKPRTLGRDSAILAVCWDDWEEGVKGEVSASEYKLCSA